MILFTFLNALSLSLSLSGQIDTAQPYCRRPDPSVLQLAYDDFDSPHRGWRVWGEGGCLLVAADMLKQYRLSHVDLDPDKLASLLWHEGQMRAADGDSEGAIQLMQPLIASADNAATSLYYQATIAFLKRDRPALLETQEQLMAIPEPGDFARAADQYVSKYHLPRPVWPMNADIVDGLVRCFDHTYADAYGACPPAEQELSAQ